MVTDGEKIGVVTNYFTRIGVAVIRLSDGDVGVGDVVRISGRRTELTQPVTSLQIEHRAVSRAERGGEVALKVLERVRPHDQVFRVRPPGWPSGIVGEPWGDAPGSRGM